MQEVIEYIIIRQGAIDLQKYILECFFPVTRTNASYTCKLQVQKFTQSQWPSAFSAKLSSYVQGESGNF